MLSLSKLPSRAYIFPSSLGASFAFIANANNSVFICVFFQCYHTLWTLRALQLTDIGARGMCEHGTHVHAWLRARTIITCCGIHNVSVYVCELRPCIGFSHVCVCLCAKVVLARVARCASAHKHNTRKRIVHICTSARRRRRRCAEKYVPTCAFC